MEEGEGEGGRRAIPHTYVRSQPSTEIMVILLPPLDITAAEKYFRGTPHSLMA